ncbi:hypothetical protein [Maribacter antarcticus]|uniref:hypothetical protein n=1 Tax=Maribacter antarcticus TaxID=505250 RepID=UPI00047B1B38|nr:hypothetical protein [Maribacter antarcticus]
MKIIINILVVFFSVSFCFSQTTISLKKTPFEIKNQNFYIENVVDNRQEMHLGVIEDDFGNKETLRFLDGTELTIKKFMDVTLLAASDKTPINIRINNLKIEQVQTSIDQRTARVYVELHFYTESGKALYKVAHYEDQVFPESNVTEIYETHEKRIRAALESCLRSFITAQKANTDINTGNVNLTPDVATYEAYSPLGKWFNLLTYKRLTDRYNEGWNVAYTGFSDHEKDLIIPFVLSYGQSRAKSNILQERGYSSVDSYAFGFGFNGFLKIAPGFYLDIGVNVPIGMEVLRDLKEKKSHNFLIGLGASQGVKIIPWKDFGIVIGAGIFQRWQTSKVINKNFGFQLELGFNF